MDTAVRVLRGNGCPSFFMSVSSQGGAIELLRRSKQPACPAEAGGGVNGAGGTGSTGVDRQSVFKKCSGGINGRRASGIAVLAGSLTLSGCVRGPLSTLQPASEVAQSVATLWWVMAAGTGVVLVFMVMLAILAVLRHPPHAPKERGIRMLLVGGGIALPTTVIAALLIASLRLDHAQWPPYVRGEAAGAFHVDLIAHRWWWEVRYPGFSADRDVPRMEPPVVPQGEGLALSDALRSINIVHIPAGVPVHLRIMSADVIHAFWVPRVAGKLDAVPGKVNRLRLKVDAPGEYAGVCAEYCGEGHAMMPFTLVAHTPETLEAAFEALRKEGQ